MRKILKLFSEYVALLDLKRIKGQEKQKTCNINGEHVEREENKCIWNRYMKNLPYIITDFVEDKRCFYHLLDKEKKMLESE